jgi:hypothetical protein
MLSQGEGLGKVVRSYTLIFLYRSTVKFTCQQHVSDLLSGNIAVHEDRALCEILAETTYCERDLDNLPLLLNYGQS